MRMWMMAAVAFVLCGCQNLSQSQRYELASASYAITTNAVTAASKAELLSLDELETYGEFEAPAYGYLSGWREWLIEGNTAPYPFVPALERLLDEMLVYRLMAEKAEEAR